jgi:multiple sugar transport system substrate-binding protein
MHMSIRRWVLPALTLFLLVLPGCLSTDSGNLPEQSPVHPAAPVVLSFWNPFGGGEGDYVERIIADFNASQEGIFVKQLRLESNEYYAWLSTALSFGSGPDVAVVHADRLSPFIKAKRILGLDDLADKASFHFDELEDSNLQAVRYDGSYYAVPLDTHFHMLYYNKNILKEAGLLNEDGTPKLGKATAEDFVQFLQRIRARVPGVEPFAVNTPYFHESFLDLYYEAGGELLSPDGRKATIHNDQAVRVLTFYQRLFAEGLSDPEDQTPWDTFDSGKAGLWFGGVWEAGHYLDNSSLNIGIAPLPPLFGSSEHWGSSHTLVIPAYATEEKQQAAMTFIKYFSEVGSSLWAQAGHIPASKAVADSPTYQELPYRKQFIESRATVKPAPKTDKYAALLTSLSEDLQSIIRNGTDLDTGLDAAEKKLNLILTN